MSLDFKQVVDGLGQGVAVVDRDGAVLYWNRWLKRASGRLAEAVRLFSRWLNDYLRQVATELAPSDAIDLRSEEDRSMLAENFRIWRKKVFAEGKLEGKRESDERIAKTARKLLARGQSPEAVAELVELSVEELRKLVEEA